MDQGWMCKFGHQYIKKRRNLLGVVRDRKNKWPELPNIWISPKDAEVSKENLEGAVCGIEQKPGAWYFVDAKEPTTGMEDYQVCQIPWIGWVRREHRSSHEMCHHRGHGWHWLGWFQWCSLKERLEADKVNPRCTINNRFFKTFLLKE